MGNILKNTNHDNENESFNCVKKWDVITKDSTDNGSSFIRKKKIIKAREAVFSSLKKQVPNVHLRNNEPVVTLIEDGDEVKGLEIICRCGEKIIVHFNLNEIEDG